jgi:hypothetical protein
MDLFQIEKRKTPNLLVSLSVVFGDGSIYLWLKISLVRLLEPVRTNRSSQKSEEAWALDSHQMTFCWVGDIVSENIVCKIPIMICNCTMIENIAQKCEKKQ